MNNNLLHLRPHVFLMCNAFSLWLLAVVITQHRTLTSLLNLFATEKSCKRCFSSRIDGFLKKNGNSLDHCLEKCFFVSFLYLLLRCIHGLGPATDARKKPTTRPNEIAATFLMNNRFSFAVERKVITETKYVTLFIKNNYISH